jgi:hypothetical protein
MSDPVPDPAPHDGPIVGSYQGLPTALSYQR